MLSFNENLTFFNFNKNQKYHKILFTNYQICDDTASPIFIDIEGNMHNINLN